MKLRMKFLPIQINRVLPWVRNTFLILGVLVLSYVGYVLLDARIFQDEQAGVAERVPVREPQHDGEHAVVERDVDE